MFSNNFPKKTGKNSEWPKICIPNLLKPFWYRKTGRNLEWPKMSILNLFKSVMVSNGLKAMKFVHFWVFEVKFK